MKPLRLTPFLVTVVLAVACQDSGTLGPKLENAAPRASGQAATETAVSGAFILDDFSLPPEGRLIETPSGNFHLDDFFELYWIVTGDIEGTAVSRQSGNQNKNGGGVIHSTMDVSVTGHSGGFVGDFAGYVKDVHLYAQMVLQGTGDFQGMKLQIAFDGPLGLGNAFSYEGRILSPSTQ